MREKLARFFYGRNGMDNFSVFLWWAGLILLLLSSILRRPIGEIASSSLWALSLLCIVFSFFRILSKNRAKRSAENAKYLQIKGRLLNRFRGAKTRYSQRRDYKFFKCPECRSVLRVPRGKGRIYVTCRKCGARFEAKS